MSMFEVGALVVDHLGRCTARITHVQRVPRTLDLLGYPIPAHRRYTVAYVIDDVITGEWNDNRMETDLAPIQSEG